MENEAITAHESLFKKMHDRFHSKPAKERSPGVRQVRPRSHPLAQMILLTRLAGAPALLERIHASKKSRYVPQRTVEGPQHQSL